jgi:hypothetical protein
MIERSKFNTTSFRQSYCLFMLREASPGLPMQCCSDSAHRP